MSKYLVIMLNLFCHLSLCGLIEFMAIYLVCCLLDRWFFFFFYHRWFCFVILLLWKLEVYWWEMNLLNLAASWRKTKKQHLKKKNIFKIWAITGKLSTILIQPRKIHCWSVNSPMFCWWRKILTSFLLWLPQGKSFFFILTLVHNLTMENGLRSQFNFVQDRRFFF